MVLFQWFGKNDYNMAVWAKDNGKVVINNGYFTNVGAATENDPSHFDLIYASGNAQIEKLMVANLNVKLQSGL